MFFEASKILGFFSTPSNVLTLALAVGLALAALSPMRRLGHAMAGLAAAALLTAGFSPLANLAMLPLEQRFPPPNLDDPRPVSGVVVLGGAVMSEESAMRGQLVLNDAAERILALADLARRHPGAKVIFSGGAGGVAGLTAPDIPPEADLLAAHMAALGLDPARVIFETRSRNTHENAVFSREIAMPSPGERWLLVTSAWHMPRAVGVFRRSGFPVEAYSVDYRTTGPKNATTGFAFASDGLRRLDVAVREWVGLTVYRVTGRTDSLFPAP